MSSVDEVPIVVVPITPAPELSPILPLKIISPSPDPVALTFNSPNSSVSSVSTDSSGSQKQSCRVQPSFPYIMYFFDILRVLSLAYVLTLTHILHDGLQHVSSGEHRNGS